MAITAVIDSAGEIITNGISITQGLAEKLPFFLLPMGFVFARKFIGMAKSLTLQSRGRRR